jgi:hypothetical protein
MIIEYKALRSEVTARLKIQTDILAFMLAGLAVLFGIAFRYEVHEIFLIIPFLTITTGFLYVSTIARVAEIGEYIKTRIEDKTNGLGWENYLESKIYKRRSINFAYRIGAILIFIIPTIISLLVYILSRWIIIKLLLSLAIIIFAIIGMYIILLFILCDALYYSTKKR